MTNSIGSDQTETGAVWKKTVEDEHEQSDRIRPYRDFAGLGFSEVALDANDVAEVEGLDEWPIFADSLFGQPNLYVPASVAQGQEHEVAHHAEEHDSPSHASPFVFAALARFEVEAFRAGSYGGDGVYVAKASAIRVDAQIADLGDFFAALVDESIFGGHRSSQMLREHCGGR